MENERKDVIFRIIVASALVYEWVYFGSHPDLYCNPAIDAIYCTLCIPMSFIFLGILLVVGKIIGFITRPARNYMGRQFAYAIALSEKHPCLEIAIIAILYAKWLFPPIEGFADQSFI